MPDRSRFFSSLAWRLTLWYGLSSFFMILLIASISYYALLSAFAKETDGYLTDTISQLKGILQNDGEKNLKVVIEKELPTRLYLRTFARVLDEAGNVQIQSPNMQKILPQAAFPAPIDLDSELPGVDYFSVQRGRTYRAISVKIDEPQKAIFQVACDRRRESGILKRYKVYLIVVLASSFLLCAAGGFLIARRGIAPVLAIADAAGQIGHVTLHERINSVGLPEELRQLAFSFNAMLDRLEASFARISQFSEDIAHELRTPVNNLRGGMEVVLGKPRTPDDYRDAIGSALEECERLARLVDRLLFIARSENSEGKIERDSVNVLDELLKTREFYEATAEESCVTIAVNAGEQLKISANRDLLRSLIGNLVSNALAHTPRGGRIDVDAAAVPGGVAITITDTGHGIPAEHLPHIFDRFYRVDRSRTERRSRGDGIGIGDCQYDRETAWREAGDRERGWEGDGDHGDVSGGVTAKNF